MYGMEISELKKMRECESYKQFNIKWIPAMYLIDPDGKVMLRTVKAQKLAEQLKHLNYSKFAFQRTNVHAILFSWW